MRPEIIPTTVRSRSTESASRVVVGEVGAEVAEAGGAEQRVDHGMGEDVGVGVAGEAALVLDLDPAEDERAAVVEAVAVVADPDRAHGAHLRGSLTRTESDMDARSRRTQSASSPTAGPSGSSRRSRPSKTQISRTPRPSRNSTARS
jgi:hypothetical protein